MKTEKESTILVFRHGHTRYWQGNAPTSIDVAWDLAMPARIKPENIDELSDCIIKAIENLALRAEKAITFLEKGAPVEIISSPTGRGLHTARVVHGTLMKYGFLDAGSKNFPKLEEALTEVRNFKWDFFLPLCIGGEVNFNGKRFVIDKNLSNPGDLRCGEYFANDVLHTLPASVKSMWPRSYVRAIENFERSASVRKRMRSVLRRLGETQSILITHDALCGFMVKAFTRGVQNEIAKGDFLVLEGNSEHLVVKAVGDNCDGDSETNIFDLV